MTSSRLRCTAGHLLSSSGSWSSPESTSTRAQLRTHQRSAMRHSPFAAVEVVHVAAARREVLGGVVQRLAPVVGVHVGLGPGPVALQLDEVVGDTCMVPVSRGSPLPTMVMKPSTSPS